MHHEKREGQFFTFYTLAYGVTILLAAAENLFTMYVFYECLTIVTVPLVGHSRNKESFRAARSYMVYLIGGASLEVEKLSGIIEAAQQELKGN